jgi:hypothetical protein
MKPPPPPEDRPRPARPRSLCESCRHVRVIRSERGSVFLLCKRSTAEPEYPKYPPQPVVACRGFQS